MQKASLFDRAISAARHTQKAAMYVAEQQHTVADFERIGIDASRAKELLVSFEAVQGVSTATLDSLGQKLA